MIKAQLSSATLTVTDRPGRSRSKPACFGSKRIRTGTRWTIFVKLPVPGSNGSSANCEPEPGAKLSTVPVSSRSGIASTLMRRPLPGTHAAGLRLFEVGGDVEVVQRHQRHQARARLHVVALLHLAIADYAVDRRDDHRVSLILLRKVERRASARDGRVGFPQRASSVARLARVTCSAWRDTSDNATLRATSCSAVIAAAR